MTATDLRIQCYVKCCEQRLDAFADQHVASFARAIRALGWALIDTDEKKYKDWRRRFGDRRLFLCPFHARVVAGDPEKLWRAYI